MVKSTVQPGHMLQVRVNSAESCDDYGIHSIILSGEGQRFSVAPLDQCLGIEFIVPDDIPAGTYDVHARLYSDIVVHVCKINIVDRVKVSAAPQMAPVSIAQATPPTRGCNVYPKAYNRVLACDSGWND